MQLQGDHRSKMNLRPSFIRIGSESWCEDSIACALCSEYDYERLTAGRGYNGRAPASRLLMPCCGSGSPL